MRYQAIKHLKTKSNVLGVFKTLHEASDTIKTQGGRFTGLSYFGGFPTFEDSRGFRYTIQGYSEAYGIVCSLPKEDTADLVEFY